MAARASSKRARKQGRTLLTEIEAKQVLEDAGVPRVAGAAGEDRGRGGEDRGRRSATRSC